MPDNNDPNVNQVPSSTTTPTSDKKSDGRTGEVETPLSDIKKDK